METNFYPVPKYFSNEIVVLCFQYGRSNVFRLVINSMYLLCFTNVTKHMLQLARASRMIFINCNILLSS